MSILMRMIITLTVIFKTVALLQYSPIALFNNGKGLVRKLVCNCQCFHSAR